MFIQEMQSNSAVLGREELGDTLMQVIGQFLFLFYPVVGNRDWPAYADDYFAPVRQQLSLGQDGAGIDKTDRHHRHSRFNGQDNGSAFERLQAAVNTAGPLRKNQHGGPRSNLAGRVIQAFQSFPAVRTVDRDIAGPVHGLAEKRDPEEFFFGYPTEFMRKIALETEDIELTDMIADKDVGPVRFDMFRAFNSDAHSGQTAYDPAPDPGKHMGLGRGSSDKHDIAPGQDTDDKGQRRGDKEKQQGSNILRKRHDRP